MFRYYNSRFTEPLFPNKTLSDQVQHQWNLLALLQRDKSNKSQGKLFNTLEFEMLSWSLKWYLHTWLEKSETPFRQSENIIVLYGYGWG